MGEAGRLGKVVPNERIIKAAKLSSYQVGRPGMKVLSRRSRATESLSWKARQRELPNGRSTRAVLNCRVKRTSTEVPSGWARLPSMLGC